MTTTEFSNEFDTLVNSYHRFKDFDRQEILDSIEFDEYEKSLYLTKAQEELVLSLYSGRNANGESFETTEEMRRHLGGLVGSKSIDPSTSSTTSDGYKYEFTLPTELWFIIYENVTLSSGKCEGMTSLDIYPVRHDEYAKLRKNPFRGANDRRALRLDIAEDEIEIISKYPVSKYNVKYLKKLDPIILADLPDDLTIQSKNTKTSCVLHEGLHRKILELAVMMALQGKGIGVDKGNEKSEKR